MLHDIPAPQLGIAIIFKHPQERWINWREFRGEGVNGQREHEHVSELG